MEIVWLGHEACHTPGHVGGKAAHLSRLAAGYPVPPGFCLTAASNYEVLRQPGDPAHGVLRGAYHQLGEQCGVTSPSVAVRSSAIDEDGSQTSFAGLHDTLLNVVGHESVAEAILQCWGSVRSERALTYRQQMGLATDDIKLAVLVQQLVPSDCSAVAFSGNPVTGARDEVVIEANWGLGESIVSGMAAPDTFIVGKADGKMRQQVIGAKARMTIPSGNGTREVDTPRAMRAKASLEPGQITQIIDLLRELEAEMGWPVDVECAFHGGKLYLLQCRPITKLG